jgi:hypothetical protein
MTIYARYGGIAVTFKAAQLRPVWVERRPGEVKWHLIEPKRTKLTQKIERFEHWYVVAQFVESGRLVAEGNFIDSNAFVADDGIREIHAACEAAPREFTSSNEGDKQ